MARYLVIEFESNESAERLMQRIDDARAQGALYRVVGLFVKPRNLCHCGTGPAELGGLNYRKPSTKHGMGGGIVYGKKYGWWVCTECKRPRRGGHQLINQLSGEQIYEAPGEDPIEMVVTNLSIYGAKRGQYPRRALESLKKKTKKKDKVKS